MKSIGELLVGTVALWPIWPTLYLHGHVMSQT